MTTPDHDRIARLEETLGFVEHRAERSRADLSELSRQVYELTHLVAKFERRLDSLSDRLPPATAEVEGEEDAS